LAAASTKEILERYSLGWSKTYGGTRDEAANSVIQTSDRGFVITGYTGSLGAGDHDMYLVKTDSGGNMLWDKRYGGKGDDRAFYGSDK
jgi:hypothetical protein